MNGIPFESDNDWRGKVLTTYGDSVTAINGGNHIYPFSDNDIKSKWGVRVADYFKSESGYKALYPGNFGIPSEDCNCRCCLLQRAEWALSDEEFTKMNGKTNELQHFESIDDYNKFKKIFWEVSK